MEESSSRPPPAGRAPAAAIACPRLSPDTRRPPHIIQLMADDLGSTDASFLSSSRLHTPHLDRLAAQALHLPLFRTPAWCAPSRAAFLTGRHGWELGIASSHGWTILSRDTVLLSEWLRARGYWTALVGKLHVNPRTCSHVHTGGGAFGCGFDQQYGFVGGMSDYYQHHATWSRDGRRLREQGYATELFGNEAEAVVLQHARVRANMSLFLWLSPNAPHTPLQAPEEWVARQPTHWRHEMRVYAAMVGCMDAAFGKAIEALRVTGMLRSSLVLFMSDNGGPLIRPVCNGGLRGGKGSPFEGGMKAPMFIHWPACLGETRRTSHVAGHMVDLFATLAAAAAWGLPHAHQQRLALRLRRKAPHSMSLWPFALARRVEASERHRRQLVLQVSASSSAILRGRWKLVLAAARCLDLPASLNYTQARLPLPLKPPFPSRRTAASLRAAWPHGCVRRWGLILSSAAAQIARRAGVQLQLFDIDADPREMENLLAPSAAPRSARWNASSRGYAEIAGTMLGHYLGAVRVAQRSIQKAKEERRDGHPQGRGYEMLVWFCRQVDLSWSLERWKDTAALRICADRSEAERGLGAFAPRRHMRVGRGERNEHARAHERTSRQHRKGSRSRAHDGIREMI
ncbi:hypothetical protein AB1Y20_011143 [Prymnesium parvum]|uniref:Sulfatase N-terminal domain-containing protein n=1 Tax=Prymnesium parvum TaxID=97485 RepID=A0AB34IPM7_PRYPA